MQALLLLVFGWFAPNVDRLGADDFATREAETERCDNILSALFLPVTHPDPEIYYRVRWLRGRNLRWIRQEFIERSVYRRDYGLWLDYWLCPGRPSVITSEEVLTDLQSGGGYSDRVAMLRERWYIAQPWELPWIGAMNLSEFGELCDYHRCTAPIPREK